MKNEDRWAPVPTVSGKVDRDSRSTAQSGERVEPAQTPCAPGEAIARTLEAYGTQFHEQNITPVPRIQAGLPAVDLEAGEFEYVLSLLVGYAVQAMPRGGVLSVVTYETTLWTGAFTRLHGQAIEPGRYVVLVVKDTGEGRRPEMASVEELVVRRGGGIVCQAAPRQGTRVDVYMPVGRSVEARRAVRITQR